MLTPKLLTSKGKKLKENKSALRIIEHDRIITFTLSDDQNSTEIPKIFREANSQRIGIITVAILILLLVKLQDVTKFAFNQFFVTYDYCMEMCNDLFGVFDFLVLVS